jgi:hypothetical protein
VAAIRIIDDHIELASIGTNSHAQIDTHIAAADNYVKRDGSLALTSDWDIGDSRKIKTDEIRARDAAGLKLYDDGGNGIFVEDGGYVGIGNALPSCALDVKSASLTDYLFKFTSNNILRSKMTWNGMQFWYLNKGTAECGAIGYSTPGGLPGIVFVNASNAGRSQVRLNKSGGGLGFGASTTSASPPDQLCITTAGRVGIGTTSPSAIFDINSNILRLRTAKTPATAGAAGNQGDICWDANYVYVCTATNTWKRSAITTW